MARKGLPKWAIRQAGGNFKKAWRLVKRGRKKTGRKKRSNPGNPRSAPGIISKLNKAFRGLKLALPAIGAAREHGLTRAGLVHTVSRYTGYQMDLQQLEVEPLKKAGAFYAGNLIEHKALSLLKTPQMAGRKKLLAIGAQYLPEINAAPRAITGDFAGALDAFGTTSVGYSPENNATWLEDAGVRTAWLSAFGGRIALTLISRFIGPMINKHLPKGVNL